MIREVICSFGARMAKLALVLALVATQFLSWNGGALYLCLMPDASRYCLVADPTTCKCCDSDDSHENNASCVCDSNAVSRNDEKQPILGRTLTSLATNPCDCTHVLISHENSPNILRGSWTPDSKQFVELATTAPLSLSCVYLSEGGPTLWELSPLVPSQSLTLLSSVVLRC
jgi:hypothetical protein